MSDLIREAPIGQLIRFISRKKFLRYPEEEPGFQCPACYDDDAFPISKAQHTPKSTDDASLEKSATLEKTQTTEREVARSPSGTASLEEYESPGSTPEKPDAAKLSLQKTSTSRSQGANLDRVASRNTLQQYVTRSELERAFTEATVEKGPIQPVQPEKLDDGTILVDWYSTDDSANPQNWSSWKKVFVSAQICFYTTAVYMGSSIYVPSVPGVMERFGVDITAASLGLALYVLAYGIGPMLWSPLAEIPVIGRNPPYMITFAIFVIISIPTALMDNFAGLLVLRFLQGFFGSPCLATGGASLGDMYSILKLPYVLSMWAFAATCGPALGPIISGFSVAAEDWRWSLWEILWLAGPVWVVMFAFLPETYTPNILLRRAQRLRAITGNNKLKSQSEIDQASLSIGHIVIETLWRPNQMMLLDPAVAFTALYVALVYGIYYSFFEAFPLVYNSMYGFNAGELGLTFLSITVGVIIAITIYWLYVYYSVEPEIRLKGLGAPERRLIPALYASFLLPVGLFLFAWTSNPDIHWIASVIGICIFTIGIFLIMQCIFLYLPLTYPQYAASLFAGNDLVRSSFAFAAVLFSRPLYLNLGIGKGTSLLGALTGACIGGVFGLWWYGDRLRARSRFSAK